MCVALPARGRGPLNAAQTLKGPGVLERVRVAAKRPVGPADLCSNLEPTMFKPCDLGCPLTSLGSAAFARDRETIMSPLEVRGRGGCLAPMAVQKHLPHFLVIGPAPLGAPGAFWVPRAPHTAGDAHKHRSQSPITLTEPQGAADPGRGPRPEPSSFARRKLLLPGLAKVHSPSQT